MIGLGVCVKGMRVLRLCADIRSTIQVKQEEGAGVVDQRISKNETYSITHARTTDERMHMY